MCLNENDDIGSNVSCNYSSNGPSDAGRWPNLLSISQRLKLQMDQWASVTPPQYSFGVFFPTDLCTVWIASRYFMY